MDRRYSVNSGNSENSDSDKGISDLLIPEHFQNKVDNQTGERKIYIFRLGKAMEIDDFIFWNLETS